MLVHRDFDLLATEQVRDLFAIDVCYLGLHAEKYYLIWAIPVLF